MAERSRWAPGAAALADAARAVSAVVFDGRSSDEALRAFEASSQRAAVRAIALGTFRWFLRLAPAIDRLLSRPEGVAPEIRSLLIVSAHQIEYSRNAPQATAHAAVDATRILRQGKASGLVNAVMRRFVAEKTALLGHVDRKLAGRTAHPQWLVALLEQEWPEAYESILTANNAHPPLVLRVDLSRKSRDAYLEELAAVDIAATPLEWAPAAVRLERPVAVAQLPGFSEGLVSVQDAGAQLAAKLLDVQPRMRVLDACAAPGGKTGHLLECTPDQELVAVDVDDERVALIRQNLERLGRQAQLEIADIREPTPALKAGQRFDRILVDAPCSSTGVIRRHPDIKLLRRPTDVAAFAATQEQILRSAFALLAPGGRLVYCTCSVLPAENEEIVARLLVAEPSACVATMPPAVALAPGALDRKIGIQLIPGSQAGTDGFYYACVEKTTAGT
ncbi:MAG TPA: 16S rRNA (cytosine(967)-C(5))-methyltransferase RsmB [Steroidobacteraceae bacterium]|nr:16S rRNA (cytosine(967)-C(5))-methyltransferase RsmB [Steroidobacteraceae bacterium]